MDDRHTNPPSPCGSEAALEYCTDFSHQPYFKPQFSNSSPRKGANDAFVATPFIGNNTDAYNLMIFRFENVILLIFNIFSRSSVMRNLPKIGKPIGL